jgi:hypothetical protein
MVEKKVRGLKAAAFFEFVTGFVKAVLTGGVATVNYAGTDKARAGL